MFCNASLLIGGILLAKKAPGAYAAAIALQNVMGAALQKLQVGHGGYLRTIVYESANHDVAVKKYNTMSVGLKYAWDQAYGASFGQS